MNTRDENIGIDSYIYSICSLIHNISKLNIEFIDFSHKSSFQLFNFQILSSMQAVRSKTVSFIHSSMQSKRACDTLYHMDNFGIGYLAAGIWEHTLYRGTIIVGPFLSDIPDNSFISNILQTNNLPLGLRLQFEQYYKGLDILDMNDCKNLGLLIINLAVNPFIQCNLLFSEIKKANTIKSKKELINDEEPFSDIEMRYKMEKAILNAVEKGAKEEALKFSSLFQFNPSHRAPGNPLRARKDLAFSFNTLLRKAAERGGVSPVYIHNLSDKFAISIEKVPSMADLEKLMTNMISDYCDLVKRMSTAGYSPIIKKAVDYINLNFDSHISLKVIAESINVNPSHLSRQFKRETSLTVTEFINKRRIEEAKFLIELNNNSITDIALLVGFENHNYFCTVFKQITSLTPREYLNKARG